MHGNAISSLTAGPFEALVDAVYDAAFAPDGWQHVCDLVEGALGGVYVTIATHDLASRQLVAAFHAGHAPEYRRSYRERYHEKDLLVEALYAISANRPIDFAELVPPAMLEQSEFYHDWLRPQEDLRSGGGFVAANNEHLLTLFKIWVPQAKTADVMPGLLPALLQLAPHVRRSMRLNQSAQKVTSRAFVLETFMEEARAALILLDEEGRPLESNHQARLLFDKGVLGLDLRGALVIHDPAGAAYVENAVRAAVAGSDNFGDDVYLALEKHMPASLLRAIPTGPALKRMPRHLLGARSTVSIIISIASQQPGLKAAQARFGLSPVETSILSGLVEGKAIKELAAERSTSVNTVRNQVASLLKKTGTSSQKELLSMFTTARRL